MEQEQMRAFSELLTNVRLDLARLEGKVDVIKDLQHKVDGVKESSDRALDTSKAAHHRIDGMETQMALMSAKIEKYIFWLCTTVGGGLILGGIGVLWKGVGK